MNEWNSCSWLPIVRRLVRCRGIELVSNLEQLVKQFSHALVGKHDALAVVVTVDAPALADNLVCLVAFHLDRLLCLLAHLVLRRLFAHDSSLPPYSASSAAYWASISVVMASYAASISAAIAAYSSSSSSGSCSLMSPPSVGSGISA